MGKSAGKWIKSVLFGKKYSKSNLSKEEIRGPNIKKTSEKTQEEDLALNSPEIPELQKRASDSPCDAIALSPLEQGVHSQCNNACLPVIDNEKSRQEKAATKAQAAFRGYLARRAFQALNGIIRLQAVIRGHLVRRQAVATFRCTLAIVKFQALARRVRRSDSRIDVLKEYNVGEFQEDAGANLFLGSKRIATNTFVHKILLNLPTAMPLSLRYDLSEPNSAWNWLERWSISLFWEMPAQIKKVPKTQSQKNHGGVQVSESEVGKSRTSRMFSNVANGANSSLAPSEVEKPKYNPRKGSSNQTELEEQPRNELERVKHNLRKISASAAAVFEKSGMKTEKAQPLQSVEKTTNSAPPDVSEQEKLISSEKLVDSDVLTDKLDLLEAPLKLTMDDPHDVTHDNNPILEIHSLENGLNMESLLTLDDELNCKEQSGNGNHKIQKRRSLPAKQHCHENISRNSRILPSYMAATESAKAKLRAQGSPNFGEEGTEYGIGRHHSLPTSTIGKWSSLSPRMQKHVQAIVKGGNKISKSLMTSRDETVIQPGWRR